MGAQGEGGFGAVRFMRSQRERGQSRSKEEDLFLLWLAIEEDQERLLNKKGAEIELKKLVQGEGIEEVKNVLPFCWTHLPRRARQSKGE